MRGNIDDYLLDHTHVPTNSYEAGEIQKKITYGFPIPITEEILKANKELALNKDMPPEKLGEESPFLIDESPISHSKERNTLHARDFLVPVNTPILAVNDGIIGYIKEDSNEYGRGEQFGDKANYIDIVHVDGSISEYVHLAEGSVKKVGLEQGQKVRKGQIIGETGMSGWMDIPHLHFAVYKPLPSGKLENIKVNFEKELGQTLNNTSIA